MQDLAEPRAQRIHLKHPNVARNAHHGRPAMVARLNLHAGAAL
jgi:hypothetical protein